MHRKLNTLPPQLLAHLGAYSTLETLAEFPQISMPLSDLRQHKGAEPYHVSLADHGLSLMLQCLNHKAPPEQRKWGLQGFTLKTGAWRGAWPEGVDPATATATELLAQLASQPEEAMNMAPMLCFAIQGAGGQTWSVMAVFDASGKLDTFSLLRVGPWRELQQA